jgi:hypothetical protein
MSNSKRPSLQRKVTPRSEKARKEALDTGVKLSVNGKSYTVRAGDLSALDTRALRRELGLSFMGLMDALEQDPDIDLLAGLVWLARRTDGEIALTYDEVATELDYAADYDVVQAGAEVEDGSTDPEG